MAELKIITLSDIQPEPVSWLWEPYIPFGKITIVQGDSGLGKTTMMLAVTTGELLPGNGDYTAPADVIFQTAEDGLADTIIPRLEQLGADCKRIHVIDDSEYPLSLADERLEQAIIEKNAKLLIIDPIQAHLGGADLNSARGMRPLMKSLGKAAARTGCAAVIIGHHNKGGFGTKAQYRGLGSIDVQAASRSVLTVGRAGVDPNMRVVVHSKSNLAPNGVSVAFTLDPVGGFMWQGEYEINADELLNNTGQRHMSQLDNAKLLIQSMLSNGETEADRIMQAAEAQGISPKTMNRAKSALGVNSVKRHGTWYWHMPIEVQFTQDGQDGQDGQTTKTTTLTIFNGTEGFAYGNYMD